jgi:ABC-type sugar transport system substrate-binding protein
MDRNRVKLAALLTVGVMLVSACSSGSSPTPSAAPASAAPASASAAASTSAASAAASAGTSDAAPSIAAPASPGNLGTLAFIPGQLSNPSQTYSWEMIQKHAAAYGFSPIVLDGGGNIQTQTQQIAAAVAQKVKAILVNPNDAQGVVPALTSARQAGVCVSISMAKAADNTQPSWDSWVSVDDVQGGETAAKAIINYFPNGASGVEIGGQAGHPAAIDRHNGFTQGIQGKNITVLDYQNPQQWDAAQAQAIAENMITKYGNKIQFIFVHWDGGATGVLNALKAANMTNVLVIGIDGNKAAFTNIATWPHYISIQQNVETIMQVELQQMYNCVTKNGNLQGPNVVPFNVLTNSNISQYTAPGW